MVAGTSKRCTIHQVSCPEEPCPYRTFNKKIIVTADLARKQAKRPTATRSRIFYRDDYKKQMPGIFMTNDDQINCKFEPKTGNLNPHFWRGAVPPNLQETAETEEAFREKHGENLKKTHPEIYKKGVLKRAQNQFKAGEFDEALKTL